MKDKNENVENVENNSNFVKEKLDLDKFKRYIQYGVYMKREAHTLAEHKVAEGLRSVLQDIYIDYVNIQNAIDNTSGKITNANLSNIADLARRIVNLSNPQQITQAVNNYHKGCRNSPCSDIFMMIGQMNGYTIDKNNAKAYKNSEAKELVKEAQKRFKGYKFGSTQPVDENADMLVSYLTPMLLAMYGYKVDKSFVDYLVKEFTDKKQMVSQELLDLQKGKNVIDLVGDDYTTSKDHTRDDVMAIVSQAENAKSELQMLFEYGGVEAAYAEVVRNRTGYSLLEFNRVVKGFVPNITSPEQIATLTKDESLQEIIMWNYKFENGQLSEDELTEIKDKFLGMSAEDKMTFEGAKIVAIYSVLLSQDDLKANKVEKTVVETANIDNTVIDNSIRTVNVDDAVVENESNVVEEQPILAQVEPEVEGVDLIDYAENLFLTQDYYDLAELSQIKQVVSRRIMDVEATSEEDVFGNLLNSTIKFADGTARLKNLSEIYADVRAIYQGLAKPLRNVLLERFGMLDMARTRAEIMINNYRILSAEDKSLLERLAVNDEKIRVELDTKIAGLDEETRIAEERMARDKEMAQQIMDKYNIVMPKELTQSEMNDAVSGFFAELN